MNLLLDSLLFILKVFYLILEGIVLLFVPFRFRRKIVKGQRVLITGAGSGIGKLLAERFIKLGCSVILIDVNKTALEAAGREMKQQGGSVYTFVCDLANRTDIYRMTGQVKKEVGDVDIIVNNAGIVTGKKILDCPDDLMQKTMDVNIIAHFWIVKSFLPSMLKRNKGHIVTVASAAGLAGTPGLVDYCASKYGAVGFDDSLRQEIFSMGKDGIHTTVICPFYINTGMFDGVKTSRFPSLTPILDANYAADRIMDGVLCNQSMVIMPRVFYTVLALRTIMPTKLSLLIGDYFGFNASMETFIGRKKQ